MLVMISVIGLMVWQPGFRESKNTAAAWHRFIDSPDAVTRAELEKLRTADRKRRIEINTSLGVIFVLSAVWFLKSGKKNGKNS